MQVAGKHLVEQAKMKKKLFILLIIIGYSAQTNHADNPTKNNAVDLFQKVQNAMQKHYDWLSKTRTFEDPLGHYAYYFKTIQRIAPELLCNTFQYKDELLSILGDSTFKKNWGTDMNIELLLYNTTIEEYVDILNDVYRMYKQGLIDLRKFDSFLFQDPDVSYLVEKNYQNEKLIGFFEMLLQDEELINLYPTKWRGEPIKESIMRLLSRDSWNEPEDWMWGNPPLLDTLKIKCK